MLAELGEDQQELRNGHNSRIEMSVCIYVFTLTDFIWGQLSSKFAFLAGRLEIRKELMS